MSERTLPLSDVEISLIQNRILAQLAAYSPDIQDAGQTLVERISTPNWEVEWGMPLWLGQQFNLPEELTRQLLLTNVMLVAYARLFDDLADGEGQPYGGMGPALASILYHLLVGQYVSLFQNQVNESASFARFWACMDEYMQTWWRATLNTTQPVYPPFSAYLDSDFFRLAERGAFLKICPLAACLLAGQPDLIPALSASVDRLTIAVIMLDEQFDWEKDLSSGRYNTFVAFCSDLPQNQEHQELNHLAVLNEIYLKTSGRPYFEKIQATLVDAQQGAALAGCGGLVNYLTWQMQESKACGDWLAASALSRLQTASERLKRDKDSAEKLAPAHKMEPG